jgi:hypothetical protein
MDYGLEKEQEGGKILRALKTIALPAPRTRGGKPLMQALKERRSSREFSSKPLPPEMLSDLLWAAFGMNRPETHGRTAPSAHDWEEIDVYVATADGLHLYDAEAHALKELLSRDMRARTGVQDFVAEAPVNLVYVADLSRMVEATAEERARIPARMPDSSRKTSICSALPRGSRPWCAAWWTGRRWRDSCDSRPISKSFSPRRSVIPKRPSDASRRAGRPARLGPVTKRGDTSSRAPLPWSAPSVRVRKS